MRKYFYWVYDLACICAALAVALYLRHGFPLIQDPGKPEDIWLLLGVTFATTALVLPLLHTHTSLWRFTSGADLANIMTAVALVVFLTNGGLFLISRLQMMPRSVPPIHWAMAVLLMGGSRLLVRQLFGPSSRNKHPVIPKQHVIVVGACHTAELYLQFIKRIIQHEVVVIGFVDSDKSLINRIFQKHRILGTPEHIPQLLEEFLVHGIQIQQIVLAHLFEDLPEHEKAVLHEMMERGDIDLVHFGKHMSPQMQPDRTQATDDFYQNMAASSLYAHPKRRGYYPYVKRGLDVVVGSTLLVLLLPVLLLTALLVAVDVGLPVTFWQQRPGRYGKPFHLYKFRTMRPARRRRGEDRLSHKLGDVVRTSTIGKVLRRLRLDELPQLLHIIAGTMSFVGPRPLLPEDQPIGGHARLTVRPGVTGWAQIHGGDALTPEEKLVLDVWYIEHSSLWLDIRILLRTLIVVLKEDTVRPPMIDPATSSSHQGSARA